jgi:glycosyltransferase involved in cell wall biosynthesis
MMKPKVSVCMPNYNCSRYLPEAIESVLKQSYADYEFIIIDDCSTDDSLEIIGRYASKDGRIKLLINSENIGQAKNLNACLKQTTGEYIKFVFSDDVLHSADAIKKMVDVLNSNEDIALVASARYSIDETSSVIGVLSSYKNGMVCGGTDVIKDCLFTNTNKIGEPTVVMFRKKHAHRGFDEKYNLNVDWEMWFHILEQGKFAYIDEPLCSFRNHPFQQTRLSREKQIHLVEPFYMLNAYGKKPYLHCSFFQEIYLFYVPAINIWNLYRKYHAITRDTAFQKIANQYGVTKFICNYPIYKIYKAYVSVQKRVGIRNQGCTR